MVRRLMLSLGTMRAREVIEGAVVVSAAAVLTVIMTYPLAFGMGTLGRVDTGDGQFSIWNVAWVAHALLTSPAHVLDANIFYPHTGALTYAEANIGAGLLAVPAYWLTGNPYTAHNSAVLLAFILAGTGMYYLARYLTGSREAAAVAAVLFAFCPFVYARTAHIQLMMTAGLPFSLLATHRMLDNPGPSRAVALGLVVVATALACGYYGVFAGVVVGLACVYYLVARKNWRNGSYYAAVVCAAGVAILTIWPFYEMYRHLETDSQPFRALEEAREYSANWAAYLAASGLGNGWLKTAALEVCGLRWNEVLFPGLVTLSLAAVGIVVAGAGVQRPAPQGATPTRPRETALFYGLVIGLAGWLSLGPDAGLYPLFYRFAPAFSLLRAPARFGIVVTLALVVLAAVGVAHALRRCRRPAAIAAGVCAIALAELIPVPLPYRPVTPTQGPYRMLARLPPGALAEFPFFYREVGFHRHAAYMLNSTAHWKPLVNGYSDYLPVDFLAMATPVSSFPAVEAFNLLRSHGARYVMFHFDGYDRRSLEKLQDRLRQYAPYLRELAAEGDLALYEIVAWPTREPS
jgi:hypothetical protein